jgi:curved DNA-binding protein
MPECCGRNAIQMIDFYDFLQISQNAEGETIHRVYHFLAARYHPDNQKSGDAEKFRLLMTAYGVLSDPVRRAEYDATRIAEVVKPLSAMVDFLDDVDGELNRRVAVLVVLYERRRRNPDAAEVPLREIEERMGFPRDYLDFTLWYLHQKSYVKKSDSAQYMLTASGVDFVETERGKLPVLNRLLTDGLESSTDATPQASRKSISTVWSNFMTERRERAAERRTGAQDLREVRIDRRRNPGDRRTDADGRRQLN